MAIKNVLHTNEQSVDRVLGAGLPVLLYFWRASSQTTMQMDPILDKLAAQYAGKALIAKVDAVAESALMQRFNVAQLPTSVFVKQGAVADKAVGVQSESDLRGWLNYLVDGGPRPMAHSGVADPIHDEGTGNAYANGRAYANGSNAHAATETNHSKGTPTILTDANFAQTIGGAMPVLVDFWAPWCGPCRMVAPTVERLAQEFAGSAVVGKLNVDENPRTAGHYNVMSIPTLYIFKHGQVVDQLVGVQPFDVLRQRLSVHAGN